jgi:hypothetical protein
MLAPSDALFSDRKRNLPVAQKTGTDIMVVGVDAKNVILALGHAVSLDLSLKVPNVAGDGWTASHQDIAQNL